MAKAKQFIRPPKKQKAKPAAPETADDFQEAADREEEAGGKHRVGDSLKSARAFLRALELYDQGLKQHPTNFDLAYNKARLLLEITQQPALVEHVGLPLEQLLQQALEAHQVALKLNEEIPDLLFNNAQVTTALAELLSETSQAEKAAEFLQQSLELLSACLSRQEMLLEQQQMDFEDVEEGGVQLDPDEKPSSAPSSDVSERSAHVETPLTPNDLLDTVHASLSALTTMMSLVDGSALQTFADMACTLTEKQAASYIHLLPEESRDVARFAVGLDRAIFIAAFVNAQFEAYMIELETYIERLEAFDLPGKDASAHALSAEADAKTELVLCVLDRDDGEAAAKAEICWKQLTTAQDLYTKATKLSTDDAKERKAGIYACKGNVELLRHRLASSPTTKPSESIKRSSQTLLSNAQTYYKGASQLAKADDDSDLEVKAQQRWLIAGEVAKVLYGTEVREPPFNPATARGDFVAAFEECVDEGFVSAEVGQAVIASLGS